MVLIRVPTGAEEEQRMDGDRDYEDSSDHNFENYKLFTTHIQRMMMTSTRYSGFLLCQAKVKQTVTLTAAAHPLVRTMYIFIGH